MRDMKPVKSREYFPLGGIPLTCLCRVLVSVSRSFDDDFAEMTSRVLGQSQDIDVTYNLPRDETDQ